MSSWKRSLRASPPTRAVAFPAPAIEARQTDRRAPCSRTATCSASRASSRADIEAILDLADSYVALNRQADKRADALKGLTQINMFFEASTRTQASFELAGKRLGANVMNMSVAASSVKKGETLIDTAMTLNAMHPDLLVVRHPSSGAVNLLASKVNCAVLNAGDGRHEHPTQALLDALTIRRRKGRLSRLTVAICGDIAHSRVARSNIILLGRMENRIRLIAPPTLIPPGADRMGVEIFQDMARRPRRRRRGDDAAPADASGWTAR